MTTRLPAISALTLDFYGTLVRHRTGRGRGRELMEYLSARNLASRPWDHQMLYDVFHHHDRDYAPDMPAPARERYLVEFTQRLFRLLDVSAPAERHAPDVWRLLGPASLTPFPDVAAALTALRHAGYPMAVLSTWQCGLAHFCAALGLRGFFSHILASAEVGSAKPDAGIFLEAARRLGAPPNRVLHVGDTWIDDCEGGSAAGFRVAFLRRQGSGPATGTTVTSLEELPGLLAKR